MSKTEFNLLYEPWVAVITNQGEEKEVSLFKVFEQAHEYRSLAGELPTQDFAVLRLLLAILYATFLRADIDGKLDKVDSPDKALTRWKQLFDAGAFPIDAIKARLTPYEDRFYLFHPEKPFYQVAGLERGTEYSAAKLIGDLSESSNKPRLFPLRTRDAKECLSNAEAARWLLYLNAFDDTSAKPSVRGAGLPSVGAGWLGKLGLVAIEGNNLFETLLLNFVLLDENNTTFKASKAVWELDEMRRKERVRIPLPDDPLALLTLQSRRILLKRENGFVSGYLLLGGDFFDKENAFIEQMTTWRKDTSAKIDTYIPRRHRETRQVWRDFSSLLAEASETHHRPGVISWMAALRKEGFIAKRVFKLRTTGIQFADKDFYVDGIISDSLAINASLLTDLGRGWIIETGDLLVKTDKCVWLLGVFAQDVSAALGNDDEKNRAGVKAAAQERAYFALDIPFREWLMQIDPDNDVHLERAEEWLALMKRILLSIAEKLVKEAGEKGIVGTYKVGESSVTIANIPQAWRKFNYNINKECNYIKKEDR